MSWKAYVDRRFARLNDRSFPIRGVSGIETEFRVVCEQQMSGTVRWGQVSLHACAEEVMHGTGRRRVCRNSHFLVASGTLNLSRADDDSRASRDRVLSRNSPFEIVCGHAHVLILSLGTAFSRASKANAAETRPELAREIDR